MAAIDAERWLESYADIAGPTERSVRQLAAGPTVLAWAGVECASRRSGLYKMLDG